MADNKSPKARRLARSAVLSTHRSRRPHGAPIAVTPRVPFKIRPKPPASVAEAPAALIPTEVK